MDDQQRVKDSRSSHQEPVRVDSAGYLHEKSSAEAPAAADVAEAEKALMAVKDGRSAAVLAAAVLNPDAPTAMKVPAEEEEKPVELSPTSKQRMASAEQKRQKRAERNLGRQRPKYFPSEEGLELTGGTVTSSLSQIDGEKE